MPDNWDVVLKQAVLLLTGRMIQPAVNAPGDHHRLPAIANPQFPEEVLQMELDSVFRNPALFGDLGITAPLGQMPHYFELAGCQVQIAKLRLRIHQLH